MIKRYESYVACRPTREKKTYAFNKILKSKQIRKKRYGVKANSFIPFDLRIKFSPSYDNPYLVK